MFVFLSVFSFRIIRCTLPTFESSALAMLLCLSRSCGSLKAAAELGRGHAHNSSKNLRKVARAAVADLQTDIDKTARRFTNQLLSASDALPRHELQRRHARRLLEHVSKMRRTEFDQSRQPFHRDFFSQMRGDVILDFAEVMNRQTSAIRRSVHRPCVLFDELRREELCQGRNARDDFPGTRAFNSSAHVWQICQRISSRPK